MVDYFVQMRKLAEGIISEYIPPKEQLIHIKEVLSLLRAFTGDKYFDSVYNEIIVQNQSSDGGVTMDLILEKIREDYTSKLAEKDAKLAKAQTMLEEKDNYISHLKAQIEELQKQSHK